MTDPERKTINIPEICRVEGHSAVHVDIIGGEVTNVTLDVFEGTRFFERIVVNHHFSEIPHITSRVCAICSTGHVLAAIRAIESILEFEPSSTVSLFRELMHLGMIIESHATHIYALAMPDFLGVDDLLSFASLHQNEFSTWTKLRNLGSAIQTVVGGRPFHPVNLQAGGLSSYPGLDELRALLPRVKDSLKLATDTSELLQTFKLPISRTKQPVFLALIPEVTHYGYFGHMVQSSDGWQDSIQNYQGYLNELSVPYSHAKRSQARGKTLMVGSMARLALFHQRLPAEAKLIYHASPLHSGDHNTLWNNLAQSIEVVAALERVREIIELVASEAKPFAEPSLVGLKAKAGQSVGAVECPRGTLYHSYSIDENGKILSADMITPSAQNTASIELDIRQAVDALKSEEPKAVESGLETLVRAYDPCNTCATHMVTVRYP